MLSWFCCLQADCIICSAAQMPLLLCTALLLLLLLLLLSINVIHVAGVVNWSACCDVLATSAAVVGTADT
jgi:hypothetical protein